MLRRQPEAIAGSPAPGGAAEGPVKIAGGGGAKQQQLEAV